MHYMGCGPLAKLARELRVALACSATPLGKLAAARQVPGPAFVEIIEQALGRKGPFAGGVLASGILRAEPVRMAGTTLVPAEGVAESINFQSAGTARIAAMGDFVLIAAEVDPVITALIRLGIRVTALRSHMPTEQARLFFLHFWSVESPGAFTGEVPAALDHMAVKELARSAACVDKLPSGS